MKWERREGVTPEEAFKRACANTGLKYSSGVADIANTTNAEKLFCEEPNVKKTDVVR